MARGLNLGYVLGMVLFSDVAGADGPDEEAGARSLTAVLATSKKLHHDPSLNESPVCGEERRPQWQQRCQPSQAGCC